MKFLYFRTCLAKINSLLNNHQYRASAGKGMLLFAFLLGIAVQCAGQNPHKGIMFSFEKDSITGINAGDNFSNRLTVYNTGTGAVTLVKVSGDSMALITLPDTIRLAANERQTFFTKYFASVSLLREIKNKITVAYRDIYSGGVTSTGFTVEPKSRRLLSMETLSATVYINEQTNTAHIDLRCTNEGFSDLAFKLFLKSYPDGLSVTDNNREIRLAQGAQQVVSFDLRNTLPQSLTPDYGVSVQAMDANGKVITSLYVQVILLGSSKRIALNGSSDASLTNNLAQLNYWYTNAGYSYAQIYLKGNLNLTGNDALKYNINVNEYTKPVQGTEIYDSRIEYAGQHFALQAGSISDNLDFSLYGNGIKASLLPDKKNTVSAYYVDNSYFLYSSINRQTPGGRIWAASYDFHPSTEENIKVNFLHGTSPLTNVQTNLANTDMKFPVGKNQLLEIEGGISRESIDSAGIRAKNGASGGVHYKINGQQWNFSSDNYLSSNYYSGFRRGQALLDQYLTHVLSKRLRVYVHYRLINSTPEYLNNYYYSYSPNTKASTYEAGIGIGFGKLNINLHPYYYTQGLRENFDTVLLNIHSTALHAAMDASYSLQSNMFMLSVDAGKVRSNNPYLSDQHYNAWTVRFNYNYKAIGFNANIQYNPLYIIQETSPWQAGSFRQYSLGPALHLTGAKGKLDFQASDYLNYYSYSEGWNNAFQSQLSYRWAATWSGAATVMYNAYGLGSQSRFVQTRVSVTKSFIQANAPGYKKLSLQFFGDENANGVWDAGEKPVPDVIAEIDNSPAQSNRKGKLAYTNLKTGNYDVHIQSSNGWYILKPISIFLKRNRSLKIGLIKSATVQGRIAVQSNAYVQSAMNIEGIEITATDNAGNKYTTLTDADGNFQMELPLKEFTLSVETAGHSFSVSNQAQKITLKQTGNPEITFSLTDTSRKVDIKQF